MKKVMFLMAVAGMFAFAACNNNAKTEEAPAEEIENVEVAAEETAQDEEATEAVENAAEETAETAEAVVAE